MHEYWSRVWIVQEVLLAKEVLLVWEGQEIAWSDLKYVFEHNSEPSATDLAFPREFLTRLSRYLKTMHKQPFEKLAFSGVLSYAQSDNLKQKPPLIEVMLTFQYHQAYDFHDQVFAFLSLADISKRGPLKIDYKDSADELWCRIVSAAASLPSEVKMYELARLMDVDSNSVRIRAIRGYYYGNLSQSGGNASFRICHHCTKSTTGAGGMVIAANPGSRWATAFGLIKGRLDAVVPLWAIPWQEEDDPAPVHVVHQDNMRAIDGLTSGLKFSWGKMSDDSGLYLTISGHVELVRAHIRLPPTLMPQARHYFLPVSCSTPSSDCCQRFLDVALSVSTTQAFLDTLSIPESAAYGVVDMGHWTTRPYRDNADHEASEDLHGNEHFFLLIERGESVSDLASTIVSELAEHLSGLRAGRNVVWLADCPQSSRSSRKDVLNLIKMCRQACWDNGDSKLFIDDREMQ